MKNQLILLMLFFCSMGAVNAKSLTDLFDRIDPSSEIPTTQLRSSQCGGNVDLRWIYCDKIDEAEEYQFEFVNGNLVNIGTLTNTANYVYFGLLPKAKYNKTYYIRVKVKVGGVWGEYGETCTVTTNPEGETKIVGKQCGQTIANAWLYAKTVSGADKYRFRFANTSGAVVAELTSNVRNVWLPLAGLTPGETYNVTVSLNIASGWTAYGPSCSITLENFVIPTSSVHRKQCGQTVDLAWLYAERVIGADEYEFEFTETGGALIGTLTNSDRYVWFGLLGGVANGTSYDIRVRARIGVDWGDYGSICQVTTSGGVTGPMAGPEAVESVKVFTVYPNPSNGTNVTVALENSDNENGYTIRVYNPLGSLIYNETEYGSQHKINFLDNVSKGVYIVHIESDGKYQTKKLVIQ